MRPLRRFTDACVRATARRWPEDLTDTMIREWRAELAHLREHGGSGYRQLAFALSLVFSPAAGTPAGWRGRLPRVGPATMLTLLYAAAGVVAVDLQQFGTAQLSGLVRGATAISAAGTAAVVLLMAVAGWLVGRRVPVAGGPRPLVAAAAVALPLAVVLGPYEPLPDYMSVIGSWRIAGLAVWFLAMTFVLAAARRRATAGHGVRAVLAGLGGVLVTCDVATAVAVWPLAARGGLDAWTAPLWFPMGWLGAAAPKFGTPVDWSRLLERPGAHIAELNPVFPSVPVAQSAHMLLAMVACAVFALVATVRGSRHPVPAAAVTASGPSVDAAIGPPAPLWSPVRPVGAALVVAGALAWGAVLHWHGFDWFGFRSALGSGGLFAVIQRGALVLVGAGTAMLVAGRGPVAVPALAAPLVMLAAAREFHRAHLPATAAAVVGGCVVAAAAGGAWWLSGAARRALPQIAPAGPRRALLFVAVLASVMIPGGFGPTSQQRLLVVEYGVAAALGLGAAVAALGARAVPPRPAVAAVVVALGLGAALAGGSSEVGRAMYWFDFRFVLQVPLLMVLVLVATPPQRRRGWLGWAAATVVALAVAPGTARYLLVGGTAGLALLLAALICRRVPAVAGEDTAVAVPA